MKYGYELALILSALMIAVYSFVFLIYSKQFAALKKNARLSIALSVTANMILYTASRVYLWKTWLVVLLFVVLLFIEHSLIFRADWSFYIYQSSLFNFQVTLFYNLTAAVISVISNKDIYVVYTIDKYATPAIVIALLAATPFIFFARKAIISDTDMKRLSESPRQMHFINACRLLVLLIILLVHQQGHMYKVDVMWFSLLNIMISAAGYLTLLIIIHNSVATRNLLEYEIRGAMLEEQLQRQLLHYKTYQKYTESFRAFRHDFKNILSSVRTLLDRKEYGKLSALIEGAHDTVRKNTEIHKQYSNNLIVDAILQDTANVCEANNICFRALVNIPESIRMTELQACRLFANMANNAVEACVEMPPHEQRHIEMSVGQREAWQIIEARNTFGGIVQTENGKPVTKKPDKEQHGFGLTIIEEIARELGGFTITDIDRENGLFTLRLHLPHTR